MILGGGNWAAAELRSPPEGIINNANGAKSGNVKFMIPFAGESEHRRDLLEETDRADISSGVAEKAKIFSGASLPQMPSPLNIRQLEQEETSFGRKPRIRFRTVDGITYSSIRVQCSIQRLQRSDSRRTPVRYAF